MPLPDLRAAVLLFVNQRGQPLTRFGVGYLLDKYLTRAQATQEGTMRSPGKALIFLSSIVMIGGIGVGAAAAIRENQRQTHRAIALTGGDLKTVTADGETTVTHLESGKAYWQGPMPPGVTTKASDVSTK